MTNFTGIIILIVVSEWCLVVLITAFHHSTMKKLAELEKRLGATK